MDTKIILCRLCDIEISERIKKVRICKTCYNELIKRAIRRRKFLNKIRDNMIV